MQPEVLVLPGSPAGAVTASVGVAGAPGAAAQHATQHGEVSAWVSACMHLPF